MRNRYFHVAPTLLHCRKTCIDVIKEIQIIAVMYSFVKSRMIISITIVSTQVIDITIPFFCRYYYLLFGLYPLSQ